MIFICHILSLLLCFFKLDSRCQVKRQHGPKSCGCSGTCLQISWDNRWMFITRIRIEPPNICINGYKDIAVTSLHIHFGIIWIV